MKTVYENLQGIVRDGEELLPLLKASGRMEAYAQVTREVAEAKSEIAECDGWHAAKVPA